MSNWNTSGGSRMKAKQNRSFARRAQQRANFVATMINGYSTNRATSQKHPQIQRRNKAKARYSYGNPIARRGVVVSIGESRSLNSNCGRSHQGSATPHLVEQSGINRCRIRDHLKRQARPTISQHDLVQESFWSLPKAQNATDCPWQPFCTPEDRLPQPGLQPPGRPPFSGKVQHTNCDVQNFQLGRDLFQAVECAILSHSSNIPQGESQYTPHRDAGETATRTSGISRFKQKSPLPVHIAEAESSIPFWKDLDCVQEPHAWEWNDPSCNTTTRTERTCHSLQQPIEMSKMISSPSTRANHQAASFRVGDPQWSVDISGLKTTEQRAAPLEGPLMFGRDDKNSNAHIGEICIPPKSLQRRTSDVTDESALCEGYNASLDPDYPLVPSSENRIVQNDEDFATAVQSKINGVIVQELGDGISRFQKSRAPVVVETQTDLVHLFEASFETKEHKSDTVGSRYPESKSSTPVSQLRFFDNGIEVDRAGRPLSNTNNSMDLSNRSQQEFETTDPNCNVTELLLGDSRT